MCDQLDFLACVVFGVGDEMINKCPKCGGVFVGGHYCSGGWEIGKGYSYLSANVFSLDEGKKKMTRDEILNMPAGREMDALIAERVMGHEVNKNVTVWRTGGKTWIEPYGEGFTTLAYYSTDIAAAWQIVELMTKNGYAPNLVNDDNGNWYLAFDGTQDLGTVTFVTAFTDIPELWCESAPLAICRAALLATLEDE